MYQLREFQEKAVIDLFEHCIDAIKDSGFQSKILLESPTGSGKTVMMASLLERIVEELPLLPDMPQDLAFIWIAPNTLHIQSYNALKHLYEDSNKLKCVELDEMSNNPVLNHRELLFVNWSTLDSDRKIWRRENEQNINLESLIENTRTGGTKIILIIDEAHLAAFSGIQAIAVRSLISADVEILVTATPNFQRPQRTVSVSRRKVIEEQMIKKGVRINIGLRPEDQNGENVHIHLLRTAFKKKLELQEWYDNELGVGVINPLVLIQLPSDTLTLTEEDKSLRATLEGLLSTEYNISLQNGRLAVWLSGERNKDGLEDMNGFQDVLIFKQAIAQGWDCPRAAILVNYRTIQSPNFGIQTVGRILRMPHHRHYSQEALNYGYVYSNIQTNHIRFVPDDIDYFEHQVARRQQFESWNFDVLKKEVIINDRQTTGVLTAAFDQIFYSVMEDRYGVIQLPEIDLYSEGNDSDYTERRALNQRAMVLHFWEFNVDDHRVHIATNLDVEPSQDRIVIISEDKFQDFSYTQAQFATMFDKLCYDSITRLNRSKSWKKMRQTLIQYAEYYLGMFETDARKFYLFAKNKEHLLQDINTALERFDIWQKSKGNQKRRVEPLLWEVPEIRYFNDKYIRQDIASHAMEPFFEYNAASNPEKEFRDYLIRHETQIEWWYKNGDNGKEHFSVHYMSTGAELRLFYVDFVVKLKSGTICLFDTKTKGSDVEAHLKHNALLDYIENENATNKQRRLVGGIIIPEISAGITSFRYSKMRITDTNDLTGWVYLNFKDIE